MAMKYYFPDAGETAADGREIEYFPSGETAADGREI
jgi:hypothetical protein